jgi:hypothetical protein
MVRSSNVVSREICRTIRRGWKGKEEPGLHLPRDPGPGADVAAPRERTDDRTPQMKRADRSQSSRSSNEAEQHNSVEPRGTGR